MKYSELVNNLRERLDKLTYQVYTIRYEDKYI